MSLQAYLRYTSSHPQRMGKLGVCRGFFVLVLLSKPRAVMLPVVLLILDVWPLRRLHKNPTCWVLLEKMPFFQGGISSKLGEAYEKSGQVDLAIQSYEKALSLGGRVNSVLLQQILE